MIMFLFCGTKLRYFPIVLCSYGAEAPWDESAPLYFFMLFPNLLPCNFFSFTQ